MPDNNLQNLVVENSRVDSSSIPPRTTFQEDLTVAGQRRINLIWEITQAMIAVSITFAIIYSSINTIDTVVLTNAFFLIIGFYFSRTNHAQIGGIGEKPHEPYRGR